MEDLLMNRECHCKDGVNIICQSRMFTEDPASMVWNTLPLRMSGSKARRMEDMELSPV